MSEGLLHNHSQTGASKSLGKRLCRKLALATHCPMLCKSSLLTRTNIGGKKKDNVHVPCWGFVPEPEVSLTLLPRAPVCANMA